MPAWTYRPSLVARNASNAAASNASHQSDYGESALRSYLRGRMKRYSMDDQCCFFCGARGHHTGYFAGFGGIWLCRNRCENKYSEVVRDL